VGGSAVAQPHQRHLFTISQFAGYVGELASEAHVDLSQLGPARLGVRAKPLGQGGLGRLGDEGHALHIAGPACRSPSPGRFPGRLGEPVNISLPESSPGPAPRARQIILATAERHRLEKLAYSHTAGYQQVIRARIVLDAARGYSNAEISRRRGVAADTVRLWRGRHADEGMAGLADRHRSGRPPRFTPVHASWLNQLETFFSIVQRKVVSPNDFTDLDQVQDRLTAFEQRYNATARPFKWKFTPADLEDPMPNISVQVMPFRNTRHTGGDGPLSVIEYRDKPAVWFTEGRISGRMSEDRTEVLQAQYALSTIRAAALPVHESVAFIQHMRETNYEQLAQVVT